MRHTQLGRKKLVLDSSVKITVDGNSIYFGYATSPVATLLAARSELTGKGIVFNSTAVSGLTWRKLNGLDGGSTTAVDASIVATGKKNILIVGEGTNSSNVAPARTGPQIVSDASDYIAARKAINSKLYVILCSALPRSPNAANNVAMNTALNYSDGYYRNTLRPCGSDAFVDYRGLIPFSHDGFTNSNFTNYNSVWAAQDIDGGSANAGGPGIYVHPSNIGIQLMLNQIVNRILMIADSDIVVTP